MPERDDAENQRIDPQEYDLNRMSRWGRVKMWLAGLAVAATIGGSVYAVDSCNKEHARNAAFRQHVEAKLAAVTTLPYHKKHVNTCLTPGSSARVLESSMNLFGIYAHKSQVKVMNGKRSPTQFCIRPVDRSHDATLDSRILISGLEHGDLEGILKYETKLKLSTEIPDILLEDYSISKVRINNKEIPLGYLTHKGRDLKTGITKHHIDLVRLVEDGVLKKQDFDRYLDVRIEGRRIQRTAENNHEVRPKHKRLPFTPSEDKEDNRYSQHTAGQCLPSHALFHVLCQ
jgi:hypothetical protein